MQAINYYHNILKGIHLEIIKSDIQITLTKTQLVDLITEALSTDAGATIKRAITPLLAESFPQFPGFTNISIGNTDESGQTVVTLRQPPKSKSKPSAVKSPSEPKPESDLKSMEPLDVAAPAPEVDPYV